MNNDKPIASGNSIAALVISVAVATAAGHVFTVERVYEPSLTRGPGETSSPYPSWPEKRPRPTPLLRSNDRSRWCTIRALVDEGTYVIGRRTHPAGSDAPYVDAGIVFEDGWNSVDKVLRPDTQEFYSSKPPFLPTLIAGEYWLLKHALGWEIAGDSPSRWWVVRAILLTVNVVPLALYLILLDRWLMRLGTTEWGRLFVLVTACFGTFVTSFMGALNNHTIAACAVLFALVPALTAIYDEADSDRGWRYALAGFFAAFAACSDLPAAALLAALFGLLVMHRPRKTLLWFVPAAAVPVVIFFVCNYLAIGQLKPAYGELGGDWYVYPGSNFNPFAEVDKRRGVDWASEQESHGAYVFQSLLGHHGIFSLTPVWILTLASVLFGLLPRPAAEASARVPPAKPSLWQRWGERRTLATLTFVLSVVVIGFYMVLAPANYGGWTLGPRWLMWLTPLWLVTMAPVANRIGRNRAGRGMAMVLLGLSVLSAVVPAGSPWHHPWLYIVVEQMTGPLY